MLARDTTEGIEILLLKRNKALKFAAGLWVFPGGKYSTWFFFGDVNHQNQEVEIDDSEIKKHGWVNPQKALDMVQAGELAMMPPTYISLQRIRKCQTSAEATQLLSEIDGPRHRLVANMKNGDFSFEYCDCDEVVPVNAGMHL